MKNVGKIFGIPISFFRGVHLISGIAHWCCYKHGTSPSCHDSSSSSCWSGIAKRVFLTGTGGGTWLWFTVSTFKIVSLVVCTSCSFRPTGTGLVAEAVVEITALAWISSVTLSSKVNEKWRWWAMRSALLTGGILSMLPIRVRKYRRDRIEKKNISTMMSKSLISARKVNWICQWQLLFLTIGLFMISFLLGPYAQKSYTGSKVRPGLYFIKVTNILKSWT